MNELPNEPKLSRAEIARRNGAKSRGPVTESGKRRVGRNALRHGLLARTVVLHNESIHRFNRLSEQMRAEYLPQDLTEATFVENMIVARWRLMRLRSFEQATVDRELVATAPVFANESPAVAVTAAYDQHHIENLNRHEDRIERQYQRNLAALRQHRKWREQSRRGA